MARKITALIIYWGQVLILPLYWFTFFMPRDKKIWVFGSTFGHRFADNPKYFYLYLRQEHAEDIRAIWITRNKKVVKLLCDNEYEAYYIYSLKGLWFSLRAKVYLYDNYAKDICFWLSGGAIKINMWHGIPLKMINKDNKFDKARNPRTVMENIRWMPRRISDEKPSHYVLTTAKFLSTIFASAFGTSKILNCGYPRNDVLTTNRINNLLTPREEEDYKKILSRVISMNSTGQRKVALYLPTFRDSEIDFFQAIDRKALNDFLDQEDIMFCIKLHPKSKLKKEFVDLAGNNIIVLEAEDDPYVFLPIADVLITDYSSIYFDYLFLDKPILFFCYDLKKYLQDSREMYFDYMDFTPGPKIQTMEELIQALSDVESLTNDFKMKEKRESIRSIVFDYRKEIASEVLYEEIVEKVLSKDPLNKESFALSD